MPRTKSNSDLRSFSSSSGSHSDSDSSCKESLNPAETHRHRRSQMILNHGPSSNPLQPQLSSENVTNFVSRSAVSSSQGFYAPSIRSQDFYIQEDGRPSRSPDSHSFKQHSAFASMNRGEISSSAIASAPNVGLADDLTHRTPHFGYTSELRLHHESVPILSAKTKDTADSRFRQDSQSVHAKDSHDRASRERGNSSTRGRQESEQFLKAADSSVDPSSRAIEEMLAAFERRIDKKIRNMNAALGSTPDSFAMLCTHPPAVNMFLKYVDEQQEMQEELQLIVQLSKTMAYEHKHQLVPGSIPLFS